MNGLEDASTYQELMFRVPDAVQWALIDELDEGFEISAPASIAAIATLPSSSWASHASSPQPLDPHRFVLIGTLTPERLRLGVTRLLNKLVTCTDVQLFTLTASFAEELSDALIDIVVQAGMLGVLVTTAPD